MKKVLFMAACAAVVMTGCADMPKQDTADNGVKEEKYVMTGSRIARKSSNGPGDARLADKEAMERQLQQQAANTAGGNR